MVVGAFGLLIATAGGAQAATRYVAANGIDVGNCGTLTLPCRSISHRARQPSSYAAPSEAVP
jgi:hypothetical protein